MAVNEYPGIKNMEERSEVFACFEMQQLEEIPLIDNCQPAMMYLGLVLIQISYLSTWYCSNIFEGVCTLQPSSLN
jgi:hypothetical protein